MNIREYTEIDGERVYVGDMVGYNEFAGMGDESYLVIGCPNFGDMVEMTEITDIAHDETTNAWKYRIINENDVITVEPWKIGPI